MIVKDEIKKTICALPAFTHWPQLRDLVHRQKFQDSISVLDYPIYACRAVDGEEILALPAVAAIYCATASIHLVDDILDDDPEGLYQKLGPGHAANLALAFQSAGHSLLEQANISTELKLTLQSNFAQMSQQTAYGQYLDALEPKTEEDYWLTVTTKTPPLFSSALYLGALLGGAPQFIAEKFKDLGQLLGLMIQIGDDLGDVLEVPAQPDWRRPRGNLALLYALTAQHDQQQKFIQIINQVENPETLAEAQKILFLCGAVSYCVFKTLKLIKEARELAATMQLKNLEPINIIIDHIVEPIDLMFQSFGLKSAESHFDDANLSFSFSKIN